MGKLSAEEREEKLRRAVFVPCETKKDLHRWLRRYLELDFPDCVVDVNSNCSPMDMIFEVYNKLRLNNDHEFNRVLYYAARDSFKSLACSALEVLAMVHLNLNVGHMAAIEAQSHNVQRYVKRHLIKPYLKEFVVGDSKETTVFTRFRHRFTGANINQATYQNLSESEQLNYEELTAYTRIVICSMAGANGLHVPVFCVDGSSSLLAYVTPAGGRRAVSARGVFRAFAGRSGDRSDIEKAEILTPSGYDVRLESLDIASGTFGPQRIVRAQRSFNHTVQITAASGKSLVCTENEPVLVPGRGFIQVGDLKVGDNLTSKVRRALVSDPIVAIEDGGERWVYDFTLEGGHNFIADGFVVHNCIDEVDVVRDPKAYEESKMIPTQQSGTMPITLLTSTRKFSFGLVQKEIDAEFAEDGSRRLHIRHWNLIDVTEACPTSRHQPELKRLPIYVNDDRLLAISEDAFNKRQPAEQEGFQKHEGYAGCLTNCKLFAVCKGQLATKQLSKSPLLRSIQHTTNQFRTVSVEAAKAQLLCLKPSTLGLIYPNLDRAVHMLTPAQMAEKITGDVYRQDLTKNELLAIMKTRDMKWYGGQDYGWTHNFADVTAAVDGARAFVVNVVAAPHLLPDQIVRSVDHLKQYGRAVFGDTEDPKMVAMLRAAGHRMRAWRKEPGSVIGGINIVRMRLTPTMGEPLLFFLAGDPMVELLFRQLQSYHWKMDASGTIIDGEPDEEDDDIADGLRYLIMNVFAPKGRVKSGKESAQSHGPISTPVGVPTRENLFSKIMDDNGVEQGATGTSFDAIGSKGSVKWNLG